MKKCNKCDIEKDESEFYKRARKKKDGTQPLRAICKTCTNSQSSDWHKENPEKANKASKEYYQRNSEKRREYQKERRDNFTPEEKVRVDQMAKEYRDVNKESLRLKRQEKYDPEAESKRWKEYYNENREKELLRKREYYYSLNEEGKRGLCKHSKDWREKNPEKCQAHRDVAKAIQDGTISKPKVCDMCSEEKKLDAHHDDYSKTLDVRWLCRSCHGYVHRKE